MAWQFVPDSLTYNGGRRCFLEPFELLSLKAILIIISQLLKSEVFGEERFVRLPPSEIYSMGVRPCLQVKKTVQQFWMVFVIKGTGHWKRGMCYCRWLTGFGTFPFPNNSSLQIISNIGGNQPWFIIELVTNFHFLVAIGEISSWNCHQGTHRDRATSC